MIRHRSQVRMKSQKRGEINRQGGSTIEESLAMRNSMPDIYLHNMKPNLGINLVIMLPTLGKDLKLATLYHIITC